MVKTRDGVFFSVQYVLIFWTKPSEHYCWGRVGTHESGRTQSHAVAMIQEYPLLQEFTVIQLSIMLCPSKINSDSRRQYIQVFILEGKIYIYLFSFPFSNRAQGAKYKLEHI